MMLQVSLIVLFSVLTGVGWIMAVRAQPQYCRRQQECCRDLGLQERIENLEARVRTLEEKGGVFDGSVS